jgi:hypothetical protein
LCLWLVGVTGERVISVVILLTVLIAVIWAHRKYQSSSEVLFHECSC